MTIIFLYLGRGEVLMQTFIIPNYILRILKTLERAGFQTYLVGGCVRDMCIRATPDDWDVATSATPEQTMSLFPRTVPTGIAYGTVTVMCEEGQAEVTTFRTEGEYEDYRRPKSVSFVKDITDDLSRRDFTVNAMAMDADGNIVDPYGGLDDIKKGVLRCVGDPYRRFSEDALRMLRAVRFSAKLGYEIEEHGRSAIIQMAHEIENISEERIGVEIEKTIMSKSPEKVSDAIDFGLMDRFLLTRKHVDFLPLSKCGSSLSLRWAAFTVLLKKTGLISSAGEFVSALKRGKRLGAECDTAARIYFHNRAWNRKEIKRFLSLCGEDNMRLGFAVMKCIDGTDQSKLLSDICESGECWRVKDLAVSGKDMEILGFQGKAIGAELERLLLEVMESPERNKKDYLLKLAEKHRFNK